MFKLTELNKFNLATDRFDLHPLIESDMDELKLIISDPDVTKGLLGDISTPQRLDDSARVWITPGEYWQREKFGIWTVRDRNGEFDKINTLLGVVGADDPLPDKGIGPEMFYFFSRAVWGKGAAHETMSCVLEYLFDSLNMPTADALIFSELNPGSVRLAEKLGMRQFGRMNIVGHHLNSKKAIETMEFDVWRVETAVTEKLNQTLEHAAFRIGQLLGEGVGDVNTMSSQLNQACNSRPDFDSLEQSAMASLIESKIREGMQVPGFTQYRVTREQWLQNSDR